MVNCPYVLYQHVKRFRPSYWHVLLEVSKMVTGIWNNQFRRLPEGNNLSRHRDKMWPLQQCWIQIKRRLKDLMVAHQKELFVLDFTVFFLPDVSWLHLISKLLFEFVVIYLTELSQLWKSLLGGPWPPWSPMIAGGGRGKLARSSNFPQGPSPWSWAEVFLRLVQAAAGKQGPSGVLVIPEM